VPQSQELFS